MSQDAVDVARRGYEAYESQGVEGILQFLDGKAVAFAMYSQVDDARPEVGLPA